MKSTCKCGKPTRSSQRTCLQCHREYLRKWRKDHGGSQGWLKDAARVRSNARSYLRVYLKRGKICKLPCYMCGRIQTEPHHHDYSKPLAVTWLCKEHHQLLHRTLRGTFHKSTCS